MAEKRLSDLGLTPQVGGDVTVTGVALDSRKVEPGTLFAALPGTRVHGGEFIQYALRMKAGAILTDRAGAEIAKEELAASDAALVVVEDPAGALAHAAALFFGAQPETHGGRHRHQWQNICGQFYPPDLGSFGPRGRQYRHHWR